MRWIAAVASAIAGFAGEAPRLAYVFAVSPPEIVTVDTASWRVVDRAGLPAAPAAVAIPRDGRRLYVLVNGGTNADGSLATGPSAVVVFDTVARRVTAQVETGWGASRIVLSEDDQFALVFRDRSPTREFERAPSIAVGAVTLFKQTRARHKPSAIVRLDLRTNEIVWRRDLDGDDQNVLYSRVTGRFFVPKKNGAVKTVDLDGVVQELALRPGSNPRHFGLSADGRWLYVAEDGALNAERGIHVNARVFAIDCASGEVASTVELNEHEPVRVVEGRGPGGAGILSQSGVLRFFGGPRVVEKFEAGDFRFVTHLDDPAGALVVGRKQVRFLAATGVERSWAIDWKAQLEGEPGDDVVRVPESSRIAVPVVAFRQGPDLDRVMFVDLDTRRALGSIPVGRRGHMFAKSVGIAAADAVSSHTAWANAVPGPSSFDWNGFALETTTHALGGALQAMARRNPLLETSRDGRFAYAVSRFGNDLTIIRTTDGSIVGHVQLGGGAGGVLRVPESALICAWSSKRVTWMDSETNEAKSDDRPCDGRPVGTQIDAGTGAIVIFGERCAGIWDGRTGARLGTLKDVGKPRLYFSDATLGLGGRAAATGSGR